MYFSVNLKIVITLSSLKRTNAKNVLYVTLCTFRFISIHLYLRQQQKYIVGTYSKWKETGT